MSNGNKRKKQHAPATRAVLGKVIVFIFIVFVLFVSAKKTAAFLVTTPYFTIKDISCPESLALIKPTLIESLQGKSIFTVDLKDMQRKLQRRYPQCAQVRVSRRFPDRIVIAIQQRRMFARVALAGHDVFVDKEGIVVPGGRPDDEMLPLISGVRYDKRVKAGERVRSQELAAALMVIRAFKASEALASYCIEKIDANNLSAIDVYLSNKVKVIIDREDIQRKIAVLGAVLAQAQSQVRQLTYIDVRFDKPVVGTR